MDSLFLFTLALKAFYIMLEIIGLAAVALVGLRLLQGWLSYQQQRRQTELLASIEKLLYDAARESYDEPQPTEEGFWQSPDMPLEKMAYDTPDDDYGYWNEPSFDAQEPPPPPQQRTIVMTMPMPRRGQTEE